MAYEPPEGGALGFDLRGLGYTAPTGTALAFNFQIRPPYLPPTGNQVPIAFGPAYQPPSGSKVGLEFVQDGDPVGDTQYVFPTPLSSLETGLQAVRNAYEYVAPASVPSANAFPKHSVELFDRYITPSGFKITQLYGRPTVKNWKIQFFPQGWASSAYGRPTVVNYARALLVPGIPPPPTSGPDSARQLPSPMVAYYTRYLELSGKGIPTPSGAVPTTHIVAYEVQYLDLAAKGILPGAVGTSHIKQRNQSIAPPFIASNVFGTANLARIQVAAPTGIDESDVPAGARVDINLQRLLHHSGAADPAGYGGTVVINEFENVDPAGWQSTVVQYPTVYNLDQHVAVLPYMDTNSDPTEWPRYSPFVENKKRILGPGGFQSSRFSVIGNYIWNKAVPARPLGIDSIEWGAGTFIAFRHRKVGPEGWDSFYASGYSHAYNAADVMHPHGWTHTAFGKPTQVMNLDRVTKQFFPYDGETFGTAFIADGVRTVSPKLFYDVPSGFPEVRFNPAPIAPAGLPPQQFGVADFREFFATVFAKSTNVHAVPWVGEPIIANRNKTLAVFPSEQSLYGIPTVFNYEAYLEVGAGDLSEFAHPTVAYRNRWMVPAPMPVPSFTTVHRVRNVLPDPPSRQLVIPPSVYIGREDLPGIVPAPYMRLATIFPESMFSEKVPSPTLTRNTVEVVPGIYAPGKFGFPMLSATQYLYANSIPHPVVIRDGRSEGTSDKNKAKPRVTPHTIYAPSGDMATSQARTNHPEGSGAQPIDYYVRKAVGQPTVTNQHRSIGPVPYHNTSASNLAPSSKVGAPALSLRRRFVYPDPIRSLRHGIVRFLNVPQYVDLNTPSNGIWVLEPFGKAVVAPPEYTGPLQVKPTGFVAGAVGSQRIELFHRQFSVTGIPHRGNPQQGLTNPWGVPLVGFPREYVWGGYDLTLWGNTWVSHSTRELPTEGWESLSLIDEDLGSFRDRMRVTNRNPVGSAAGIPPATVFGTPDIAFVNRAILARGIASYNSGAHSVKTFLSVTIDGWDSLEVGDIDRWEAGLLKPYGDDLSRVGTPRLLHPLRMSGIVYGDLGEPRMASGIAPLGMPAIGFTGPSVSNPFGCTNRVVTPLPVLSQQNVPKPMVSQ